MKTISLVCAAAIISYAGSAAIDSTFSISDRGPHHRVWKQESAVDPASGRQTKASSYTELATGLHYWDGAQWQASREEIQPVADGAAAVQGQHTVHWDGNATGVVTLTTPDGKVMRSRLFGLAYSDNNQSVLIAQIQNSDGLIVAPNEVVYPAALGLVADLRYRYALSGIEQDILVRENLPPPSEYGMNRDTTRLEVWTEFLEPPEPLKTERRLSNGLVDQTLDFGVMRMERGVAFVMGGLNGRASGAPVSKTWLKAQNNRTFLVEAVPYQAIEADLATLPPAQAAVTKPGKTSRLALLNSAPRPVAAKTSRPMRLAGEVNYDRAKALVIDYTAVSGIQNSYTFRANETYFISGAVTFNAGTTVTFEGSAVLKYGAPAQLASLRVGDASIINSSPYRPVIFTAVDDDAVGEKIPISTGNPTTNYYGNPALSTHTCGNCASSLGNFHFRYQQIAIELTDFDSGTLENLQVAHCSRAIQASVGDNFLSLNNALIWDVNYAFLVSGASGPNLTVNAAHLTVEKCDYLGFENGGPLTVNLTNSLLANVTPSSGFTLNTAFTAREDWPGGTSNVFQTFGAGSHYLIAGSTNRSRGTTNLPSALLMTLRQSTTYPPLLLTNKVSTATNLYPGGAAQYGCA